MALHRLEIKNHILFTFLAARKHYTLMSQKILITRLAGLGDVASILLPAARWMRTQHPDAVIDVLTYAAGTELMTLSPDVNNVLGITQAQWPSDLQSATEQFLDIAKVVATQGYTRIICLDTWFMPCFLARVLKDVGMQVEGNTIDRPITEFFAKLHAGQLPATYFQHTNYMTSSYPNMKDWSTAWWQQPNQYPHYPDYYLKHCCGFQGDIDYHLPVKPDEAFQAQAAGKRIIAVSFKGSTTFKSYRHADALVNRLTDMGYYVWGQFDGSLPMQVCLGRLAVTDLLITVATSTQWLAKLVDCPSLMIPGAMHPRALGAELTVNQVVDCQYCCQRDCPASRDFACTDVPVDEVAKTVKVYFSGQG